MNMAAIALNLVQIPRTIYGSLSTAGFAQFKRKRKKQNSASALFYCVWMNFRLVDLNCVPWVVVCEPALDVECAFYALLTCPPPLLLASDQRSSRTLVSKAEGPVYDVVFRVLSCLNKFPFLPSLLEYQVLSS